jgi:moderate conductance mechanosensitive channel
MNATVVMAASDAGLENACGPPPDQNWTCAQVYRLTGSENAAKIADALATPLRILVVLLVAWIATRLMHRVIHRLIESVRDDGSVAILGASARLPSSSEAARMRRAQRAATVSSVLRNITSTIIWSIAVLIILEELSINVAPLIAGAGIAGIAIAFGTQSIVRDYLGGVLVVLEDQYGVGDEIDTGVAVGTVEFVSLRMTRIRDADGVPWYIPNGEIKKVGNFSKRIPVPGIPAEAAGNAETEETTSPTGNPADTAGGDKPDR